MEGPAPAPSAAAAAARRTRSPGTYVGTAALLGAGLAVAGTVIELAVGGVDVGSGIVLVVGAPLLAMVASVGLFLSHRAFRLVVIAAAIGGMAVLMVVAALPIVFIQYSTYLLAALLVWLLVILMLVAVATAWRESGLRARTALLMLGVGGVGGLAVTAAVFWLLILIALVIHPVYL
jgi:hypothetical protein